MKGRGRAGEHLGIPSVPKNTLSHSSERASPPPRSWSVFLPSPLSSPPSKSIGVSGIITLSLGYPPIPKTAVAAARSSGIYNDLSNGAGTREEIDTI